MKKMFPALALCVCAAADAGLSINVGTVYDYLDSGQSSYLKRVSNSSDMTAFVRIDLLEITFDADGTSIETPIKETSGGSTEGADLLSSPSRLIIPPNGTQATRLIYKGDRDVERYYRVRFVPVTPEQEDSFEVDETERAAYKQQMSVGVNVLTGYGTVFYVRPTRTYFNTKLNDAPENYQVVNGGNTTVELSELTDCDAKIPDSCLPVSEYHLRPGKTFSFEKEAGRVYSFNLKEEKNTRKVEVRL